MVNLALALKDRPFALALVPLDGSRALVRRLCESGMIEVDPLPGVLAELRDPRTGCSVCLSDGVYQKAPAGRLIVAALCCSDSQRAEVARALEGGQR